MTETFSEVDTAHDDLDSQEEIALIRDTTHVSSEKDSDESSDENNMAVVTLEMEKVSSRLDQEGPLRTFIDCFKQKYNISVDPNDIAIFV